MLLSREAKDLGAASHAPQGSQASPRGEAKTPLSSRVRGRGAGTLSVPLGGTRRVGGLLGVAGRLSGTVSPFRAEQGTSLETPSRARASSCEEVGTTWFFSSCGGILVLRRGITGFLVCRPWVAQSSIVVASESWGCARVTAGPKRPHLGLCPGPNAPLQGRQVSRS